MQGGATCFSEPYSLDKANRYEIIRTVGKGAFGEVHVSRCPQGYIITHRLAIYREAQQAIQYVGLVHPAVDRDEYTMELHVSFRNTKARTTQIGIKSSAFTGGNGMYHPGRS